MGSLLQKEGLQHRLFPVDFAEFLRTPFFTEHPVATSKNVKMC